MTCFILRTLPFVTALLLVAYALPQVTIPPTTTTKAHYCDHELTAHATPRKQQRVAGSLHTVPVESEVYQPELTCLNVVLIRYPVQTGVAESVLNSPDLPQLGLSEEFCIVLFLTNTVTLFHNPLILWSWPLQAKSVSILFRGLPSRIKCALQYLKLLKQARLRAPIESDEDKEAKSA
ncbi:hypothetical protein SISSUDRAFT_1031533 [Sistotremastrum suecicum HHB10207 ss-3]|uniref:Uncharacterized protein n=1 Tax=Sistotremastrum suecicum HHB10207 ss-3 TaxID=1314776 RepID=A0A166FSB1_9AGAM|nr:hypothetical protein SISSUDRAFT_1031533 [Sistotremastrum suecicum HHB10207 ss-3]